MRRSGHGRFERRDLVSSSGTCAWSNARLCAWLAGSLMVGLGVWSAGGQALHAQSNLQVSARIEPQPVGLDQPARFTLTVEAGGIRGPGGFEPSFELENFEIIGGPSVAQSMRIGTGGSGRTISYTWYLRAGEVGQAAITSIIVRVGNRDVSLPNQRVQVIENAPQPPPSARDRLRHRSDPLSRLDERFGPFGRDRRDPFADGRQRREPAPPKLFLRSVVTNDRPWVGQRIDYVTYLYTQADVLDLQPIAVPQFEGFWVRNSTPPNHQPQGERVEWEGEPYTRIALFRRTLYPLRAQPYVIEPIEARLLVRQADPGWRFTRLGVPATLSESSNPVRLAVRDLPAAPTDFSGAVGRTTLDARLAPETLEAGQAATLRVEVVGSGQIEALQTPRLDLPEGLIAFPAQEEAVTGDGRTTTRIWRYPIVAKEPGEYRLRAPSIRYFDPATEAYAATETIELTLVANEPSASEMASSGGRRAALEASTGTLHPIRSASVPVGTPGIPWRRILPWAFAVPWLLGVALLVARRPRGGAPGSVIGHRWKRPSREEKARLGQLATDLTTAARAGRPRKIATSFEEAWRKFLETTGWLRAPTATGDWPQMLSDAGANDAEVDGMRNLLADLHYLRYAPELSATNSLTSDLIARSRELGRLLIRPRPGASAS